MPEKPVPGIYMVPYLYSGGPQEINNAISSDQPIEREGLELLQPVGPILFTAPNGNTYPITVGIDSNPVMAHEEVNPDTTEQFTMVPSTLREFLTPYMNSKLEMLKFLFAN